MNNYKKLIIKKESINKITENSWEKYLDNQDNFGHAERVLSDFDLISHIKNCLNSSEESILRIKKDTRNYIPKYILEIGSSVGFLALQAKNLYPDSIVIGIEPEKEAIKVSKYMLLDLNLKKIFFLKFSPCGTTQPVGIQQRTLAAIKSDAKLAGLKIDPIDPQIAQVLGTFFFGRQHTGF